MARANIAQIHPDGTGRFVYLHYGDPLEYGGILLEHYQTEAQIRELLQLGDLSSIGPTVGVRVDFDTAVYPNAFHTIQCLAYHRDGNDPWEHCQPRQLTGGLEQFRQDADEMSRWLYAHTPDGWAACRGEPDSRWGSIPDAVLADATTRLNSIREGIQAGRTDKSALEWCVNYIATTTARPWQPPALRQLRPTNGSKRNPLPWMRCPVPRDPSRSSGKL